MAKEPIDMKKNLQNIWLDMHFLQDIACSKEENKQFRQLKRNGEALPDGIREYQDVNGVVTGEFFRFYDAGLTENERLEYTFYGMLQQLRTIKEMLCVFHHTDGYFIDYWFFVLGGRFCLLIPARTENNGATKSNAPLFFICE